MPKGLSPSTCKKDCLRRHAKQDCLGRHAKKIASVDMQKNVPVDMPKEIVSVDMQKYVTVDMPNKIVAVDMQKRLFPSTCKKNLRRHAKDDCLRRYANRVIVDMPKRWCLQATCGVKDRLCSNGSIYVMTAEFDRVVPVDMPNKFVSVNMPKGCPSMCQNDGVRQHAKNLCPSACQNSVL